MPPVSPDHLSAQWDTVPTERQDYYRRVYQREVRSAGAGTNDQAELDVLRRLITAYREQALVPVGTGWVTVPDRVRAAAKRGKPLHETDQDLIQTDQPRSSRLLGFLLLPIAGLLLFFLFSLIQGGNNESDTLAALATPTETLTPTPEVSPTPTPLALEESDRVIRAGETSNRDYYPVLLQIYPQDGRAARVFVVQERAVNTADWRFDANPDVASWVSGLLVRPVIGLPFSEENQALIEALEVGARFELQMNTGATLTFTYESTRQAVRQDTDVFRQTTPGLVVVLIGETDADGLLTETRWVVTAVYPADQEIERLQAGAFAAVIPPNQPGIIPGLEGIQVTVLRAEIQLSEGLPPDLATVLVDVEVSAGSTSLRTSNLNWLLEDAAGNRYSPDLNAAAQGSYGVLPGELPTGSALATSLGFLVGADLTNAQLLVSAGAQQPAVFALELVLPSLPATVESLDLQVQRITYDAGGIYLDARVFNPQDGAVALAEISTWIVLGYVPSPLGPELPPLHGALPPEIGAGEALDLSLVFPYADEPYARLALLGREFALQITEGR
ncbi:MAG: DUF4352 domain-containing protein [Anaerolineae bacterium]|nr:DUF4352 domain-containing protein [Anaerolineae bacterium]